MGCTSTPLYTKEKDILVIIMPFGFIKYQVLPMGLKSVSDLFQTQMLGLFQGIGETKPSPYIDETVYTKGYSCDSQSGHMQ